MINQKNNELVVCIQWSHFCKNKRKRKCMCTSMCIKKLKNQTPIISRRLEYKGTFTFSLMHLIGWNIFFFTSITFNHQKTKKKIKLNVYCIYTYITALEIAEGSFPEICCANFQIIGDSRLFLPLVSEMIMWPPVVFVSF